MTSSPPESSWPGQIPWPYTRPERVVDAVIHALGIAFALVGSPTLILLGPPVNGFERAALGAYLTTLVCVLGVSAAYNTWPVTRVKWLLRRFDHAAIYLLIAGTYTPFLVRLGAPMLLVYVWVFAAVGVALKLFLPGRYDTLSIVLYVALGWTGVVLARELLDSFSPVTLWLIVGGGCVYTVGIVFHLWQKLPYQNAIWHGFVLTAATIHYAAIWTCLSAPA